MRGYGEQMNLYHIVHRLTLREKKLLAHERLAEEVDDVLERKGQTFALIDRIEEEMRDAKRLVLSQPPEACPRRWQLAALLGSVQEMIEDIREVERDNALMLEPIPA
jgi:hypothetical protein